MQPAFPEIVKQIESEIEKVEAEIQKLASARTEKKAELRRLKKSLASLNGVKPKRLVAA